MGGLGWGVGWTIFSSLDTWGGQLVGKGLLTQACPGCHPLQADGAGAPLVPL